MASSSHNPSILLRRLLSLNEPSPLLLCLDTVAQTSSGLIQEIVYNNKTVKDVSIVYVSFETVNQPKYANHFIDAASMTFPVLISTLKAHLPSPTEPVKEKFLVIIDSINYVPNEQLSQFISSVASPHFSLVVTYHKDIPEFSKPELAHYPSKSELLAFMATTIFDVSAILPDSFDGDEFRTEMGRLSIPRNLNNKAFYLALTNRRKSGRSINYTFRIDTESHNYDVVTDKSEANPTAANENPEMLQDLTTFNLSTSAKQKKAKDEVELPFLEAQSFNTGGAIVYEYEKDDDYDEEDPYEDPF